MDYEYLTKEDSYYPTGKPKSFLRRWLFPLPLYSKSSDFSQQTPIGHYLLRFFGSIFLMKFGYHMAIKECVEQNEAIKNSKLVEFETEEQIFDCLYNKEKDAVFVHFYTPGHQLDSRFYHVVETESSRKKYEKVQFMTVHCRRHLTFCVNKAFAGRMSPFAELYYINDE